MAVKPGRQIRNPRSRDVRIIDLDSPAALPAMHSNPERHQRNYNAMALGLAAAPASQRIFLQSHKKNAGKDRLFARAELQNSIAFHQS
jgi:hypothetical protein